MAKVEFKTNFGFFLIFLSVILLAFIEGTQIVNALSDKKIITGGEIHLIGFVIITLFMLIIVLFKPDKQNLVSFSAITLSLITILTALFDNSFTPTRIIRILDLVTSGVLIIGAIIIVVNTKLNKSEKNISKNAMMYYKK